MVTTIGVFNEDRTKETLTHIKDSKAKVHIGGLKNIYFVNDMLFECNNDIAYIKNYSGYIYKHESYHDYYDLMSSQERKQA